MKIQEAAVDEDDEPEEEVLLEAEETVGATASKKVERTPMQAVSKLPGTEIPRKQQRLEAPKKKRASLASPSAGYSSSGSDSDSGSGSSSESSSGSDGSDGTEHTGTSKKSTE